MADLNLRTKESMTLANCSKNVVRSIGENKLRNFFKTINPSDFISDFNKENGTLIKNDVNAMIDYLLNTRTSIVISPFYLSKLMIIYLSV